jgi:polar amino acid transport system substrate-binding protein
MGFFHKRSLFRILALIVIAFLSGCGKDETPIAPPPKPVTPAPKIQPQVQVSDTLASIKQRGELRVGMQVGYAPFEMLNNNGDLIGFDVEMAGLIASALKVELRLIRLNWSEVIPMLLDGRIDIIMSGMTITPEKNLQVMFATPIVETGRMFVTQAKSSHNFKNLQELDTAGAFVVSVPGGVGELRIRELLPNASFREFPDRKAAVAEIIERRAQAYIDEEFVIRALCAGKSSVLTSKFEPLTYEMIAWGVRPGDVHWLNWLNNFILKIQGDGRLQGLKKKWLHDYFLDLRAPSFN